MKRVARVMLFAAAAAALLPGQAAAGARPPVADECPRLVPTFPEGVDKGIPTTFAVAGLTDGERDRLRYHWATSSGVIVGGQGTPSVTLDLKDALAEHAELTVVIVGLKNSCNATLSLTVPPAIACIRPLDEYGNIRFEDEKARLDNLAVELQNDPAARGYIIAYGGRRGRAGEAPRRADRARDYLSNHRNIDALRLVTVDGGYRENLTVALWLAPEGAKPPEPSPTVAPSEVEIIADEPGPRARARGPRRRN